MREMEVTLLPAMLRLAELVSEGERPPQVMYVHGSPQAGRQVCVILVSELGWERLAVHGTAGAAPMPIHFTDYSKGQFPPCLSGSLRMCPLCAQRRHWR